MDEIFRDKIRFKLVVFEKAQEIAAYNFKFQLSVACLDLATNENLWRYMQPSSSKAVFTYEDIQKRIVPERQILYRLHLDLPKDLRSFSCENRTETATRGAFYIKQTSVMSSVYNHGLERCIVAAIENDKRKIEKLKSYMKIYEILNFRKNNENVLFLCDSILPMLCRENCRDSELLRKFLRLVSLPVWICFREMPRVLEYVLLQAQRGRFVKDLWRHRGQQTDIVGLCLIHHKIKNMQLVIKYGAVSVDPSERNLYIPGTASHRDLDRGPISYARAFRILQLIYDFQYHWHSPQGLRSMWRSIKEPFLSCAEIDSFLKPKFPYAIESAIEYYEDKIIDEEGCSSGPTPRSLKDLCRVDIRRILSGNYQLPFVIPHIDIPVTLKSYLNLER